jgi:hypothetical protein
MLTRSELGDYASVGLMSGDLRKYNVGDYFFAGAHDCGRGFVAGAFDAQDICVPGGTDGNGSSGHIAILFEIVGVISFSA